jgi:triphosphoribosyl-dephospho-CoA synthetase
LGRRKKLDSVVESLDMCEYEDEGFSEGEINVGKAVACFNFGINNEDTNPIINKPAAFIKPAQTYKTTSRGLTPAVDGELYTVKRCYQFRQSTIRKLNELKANHEDINVYLNTILDVAISHYYDYVFNSKDN